MSRDERMERLVHPKSCQRVTAERAREFKGGVTQTKDNMSRMGCTLKKYNVRSQHLCFLNVEVEKMIIRFSF